MLLEKRSGDLVSLRDAMEQLLEGSLVRPYSQEKSAVPNLPAVDMVEKDDEIIVKATIPGVKPEELEITLTGDRLSIKGEVKEETEEEEEGKYIYRERRYGAFCRSFTLPSVAVDSEQTQAEFEDGIPRLVYEYERSSFSGGFFLSSGKVSSYHSVISAASRRSTRSTGFCGVQLMRFSNRPTCRGLYFTPNSCRMTWPTRARVQTAPRNPYAAAPRARNSGSRANSFSDNFGFLPRSLVALRNAATPPSRTALTHWLTAPWVTPRAAAIFFCCQPCWCNSQARKRRASRQSWYYACCFWYFVLS